MGSESCRAPRGEGPCRLKTRQDERPAKARLNSFWRAAPTAQEWAGPFVLNSNWPVEAKRSADQGVDRAHRWRQRGVVEYLMHQRLIRGFGFRGANVVMVMETKQLSIASPNRVVSKGRVDTAYPGRNQGKQQYDDKERSAKHQDVHRSWGLVQGIPFGQIHFCIRRIKLQLSFSICTCNRDRMFGGRPRRAPWYRPSCSETHGKNQVED